MMIKLTNRKNRIIFILLSTGIILMAVFTLLTANKRRYLLHINNTLAGMAARSNEMNDINQAVQTLYDAENNFRIFTLTMDSSRSHRYQKELTYLSLLLDSLSQYDKKPNDLPGLLLDKKTKTALLLEAKLISDSLWDQSGELIHTISPLKAHRANAGYRAKENPDTTIVRLPSARSKQHKSLFGRVKDAILNTADTTPVNPKIIITKKIVGNSPFPVSGLPDTLTAINGFWSTIYEELAASRNSLSAHTLALMKSNERLFAALKNRLLKLKDNELNISQRNHVFLQQVTRNNAGKIKRTYLWTVLIILLFTGILLGALWHIYQYEQVLLRSKRDAEEQALLKSTFAATISHEIRGLMQAINASVEQLNRARSLSIKKEALKAINGSWGILLTLVNNVLDYSKMDQSKRSNHIAPFSPSKAIQEVIDSISLHNRGKNKIRLHTDITIAEDTRFIGNEGELKQVLFNLVNNAVKFTVKGYISIEAGLLKKNEEEALLKVSVQDTGRGISKDDLHRIFDEFFQSNPGQNQDIPQGSGLGLAIVKRIIDSHKGKINVTSEPGKGSVFSFEIPYTITGTKPEKEIYQSLISKSLAGKNMLIAEDSRIQKNYLQAVLSAEGVHCYLADNGKEALNLLKDNAIDMVLTDVNMPGMSGTELTRKIRSLPDPGKASVPVIAITGDISEKDIDSYKQADMNDYLVKPFTSGELILKIKTCLAVQLQAQSGLKA